MSDNDVKEKALIRAEGHAIDAAHYLDQTAEAWKAAIRAGVEVNRQEIERSIADMRKTALTLRVRAAEARYMLAKHIDAKELDDE
ncbi:hypothetical protein OS125_11490 [Corynebacterium sp. P7003]|uniref:Uncharacterized protein n=1 Tax=Corynebacterium pygosceleis TaxID=2800406 RepID=A0ABT3WX20_9CORY|nr:hypothetical protein [Corynebacterium pygosceleis]MCX7445854.1 hypothetical protein [Corynebacterium pygosceleis]